MLELIVPTGGLNAFPTLDDNNIIENSKENYFEEILWENNPRNNSPSPKKFLINPI